MFPDGAARKGGDGRKLVLLLSLLFLGVVVYLAYAQLPEEGVILDVVFEEFDLSTGTGLVRYSLRKSEDLEVVFQDRVGDVVVRESVWAGRGRRVWPVHSGTERVKLTDVPLGNGSDLEHRVAYEGEGIYVHHPLGILLYGWVDSNGHQVEGRIVTR